MKIELLKKIETKRSNQGEYCVGCIFEDENGDCQELMKTLTGIDCDDEEVVFVYKKEWIKCSKENVKVGNIIKEISTNCDYKIDYIAPKNKTLGCSYSDCVLISQDDNGIFTGELSDYSILEND